MESIFKIFGTIAVNNDKANKDIDETSDKAQKASSKIGSAFKKIGAAVGAYFVADKIIGFGKACIESSADINAKFAAFKQIFGDYSGKAKKALETVANAAGVNSNRMIGSFNQLGARFTGLGMDSKSATDLAAQGMRLAADSAAFWDRSLEDTSAAMSSYLNGNYEAAESLGIFTNATQLASWAADNLGIDIDSVSEAEKQQIRLQYWEEVNKASGAMGQASRESNSYENVMGNLTQAFTDFKGTIGQFILPLFLTLVQYITNIITAVTGFIQKIQEGDSSVQGLSGGISFLQSIISTVVDFISSTIIPIIAGIIDTIKTMLDALRKKFEEHKEEITIIITTAWNIMKTIVESGLKIIQGIIQVITGIISGDWETVWNGMKNILDGILSLISGIVKSVFEGIRSIISSKLESAKEAVHNAIEKIKGFFNFDWSLPKIKLPHFSISGSFSLNPPSVPDFNIDWYRKGAIFNPGMLLTEPTIFGYNPMTEAFQGGGEAGPEAVAPISTLQRYIRDAVQDKNKELIENNQYYMQKMIALLGALIEVTKDGKQVVLSTGELVGALAPGIDKELGWFEKLKKRGQ